MSQEEYRKKIAVANAAKSLLGSLKRYDNSIVQQTESLSKNRSDITISKLSELISAKDYSDDKSEFYPPDQQPQPPQQPPQHSQMPLPTIVEEYHSPQQQQLSEVSENVQQLELFKDGTAQNSIDKIFDEIFYIRKRLAEIDSKLDILVGKKLKQKAAYENRKRKLASNTEDSSRGS